MDDTDRRIINRLQDGFPVVEAPFAEAAADLELTEGELIERLKALVADGYLSRFGPMFRAERLGGDVTLAAMQVPADDVDRVADRLNARNEVAHNYERDHPMNLWFVLAVEEAGRIPQVIAEIEAETGYPVYNLPKIEEFFVGLRLEV